MSGYIAKLTNDNEATFKELIIDGIHKYLKGLNPRWPMVPVRGEGSRSERDCTPDECDFQ